MTDKRNGIFDIVAQNGSLRQISRNLPRSLADSREMLTFAALTIFIHLNRMRMKRKLSSKRLKKARKFGSVGSFIYLCR